jgi:hypothetical protein
VVFLRRGLVKDVVFFEKEIISAEMIIFQKTLIFSHFCCDKNELESPYLGQYERYIIRN